MNATSRPVSWPMYAVDPAAVARFWVDLRAAMLAAAVRDVPDELARPSDLAEHWRDPTLLLSQTCGLPFATALRTEVRYVCTPRFQVEGCEGGVYRSALVVREDEGANAVTELKGRRVAFNGTDSHSGYNALRAMIAEQACCGRFFSAATETTSHRHSLLAVRSGEADLAAIDAITLSLLRRFAPEEIAGLRVIGYTARAAGLPLITSRLTSDDQLQRLRRACADACNPERPAAKDLLLDGIALLDPSDYDAIGAMQLRAEDLGYPKLA